ncbi:MAG: hypothetical protein LZF60_90055 [Nitrospira sp.]|nr:MAG: hypothetical protein LZF60_90055 [Nitrospira sp.]
MPGHPLLHLLARLKGTPSAPLPLGILALSQEQDRKHLDKNCHLLDHRTLGIVRLVP